MKLASRVKRGLVGISLAEWWSVGCEFHVMKYLPDAGSGVYEAVSSST